MSKARQLHVLGVMCGVAAGAWLGAAEAPTKLVTIGISPFVISLAMVIGVFVARWTLPVAIKGTGYVYLDLRDKMHLIPWAILAGALWAVANTLTVFAIRDVGLSIAFPLWNTNSLVGMFWGWLLFNELRGAGRSQWMKVLGGGLAIAGGACLLAFATSRHSGLAPDRTAAGIIAALGAGAALGVHVHPLPKSLHLGHEPAFICNDLYGRRVDHHVVAGLGFPRRVGASRRRNQESQPRIVLAIPWRILLGSG